MDKRKRKGHSVTYADYDNLREALNQCANLSQSPPGMSSTAANTVSVPTGTPTIQDGNLSTAEDSDEDLTSEDTVDHDVQFYHDELDDSWALHALDTFAFSHELEGTVDSDPTPVFHSQPQRWWL